MIDVTRTQPPPSSLQRKSDYAGNDVKKQLYADFLGKCYLCESCLAPSAFQVDHQLGRVGDLEFDWDNLFPACKCNLHRPKKILAPLLDPARGQTSTRLLQWLAGTTQPTFAPVDATDVAAVNTAKELTYLHDRTRHTHGADLCSAIARQLAHAGIVMGHYRKAQRVGLEPELTKRREELRAVLSRKAPFTILIRSALETVFTPEEWPELID